MAFHVMPSRSLRLPGGVLRSCSHGKRDHSGSFRGVRASAAIELRAYLDSTQRWALVGGINNRLTEFVDEVASHEVSHQWWGHMVGWASYHEQWLSEGFAF